MAIYSFLFVTLVAIDQATKVFVRSNFRVGQGQKITEYFNIHHTKNYGVSFSLLSNNYAYGWLLLAGLSLIISGYLIYLLRNARTKFERYSLIMILAGAVGNVYDRIIYKSVTDFLDVHYNNLHWPTFNFADCFVVIGAGLLLLQMLRGKSTL